MVDRFARLKPPRWATTISPFGMKRDVIVAQRGEFGSAQIDLFFILFSYLRSITLFLGFRVAS